MSRNKETHIRCYRDVLEEINKEMPGVKQADVVRISWQQYRAVQKAGRFIYGNVWKTPKKK